MTESRSSRGKIVVMIDLSTYGQFYVSMGALKERKSKGREVVHALKSYEMKVSMKLRILEIALSNQLCHTHQI